MDRRDDEGRLRTRQAQSQVTGSKTTEKPRAADLSRILRGAISNGSKSDSRGDFMTSSQMAETRWQDEPFGEDDEGWNLDGSGRVGLMTFANAVQVWATYQDRPCSIKDAAEAFNCRPQKILDAVEGHPWLFVSGPDDDHAKMMIEHEGE